jgi:hypothetical protein
MQRNRSIAHFFCVRFTPIAPVGHFFRQTLQHTHLFVAKTNAPRESGITWRGTNGYAYVAGFRKAHFRARVVMRK